MPSALTIIFAVLAILIIAMLVMVLASPSEQGGGKASSPDVSISAAEGSVVTVRKVGRTTRVDIHPDIHDHWEGGGGVDISPTPIEITRREEPELYAEYMNPRTPASRKYAIADYIYSLGLTLPFIHGMNEQWKREQEELLQSKPSQGPVNPITEQTPVNPEGGELRDGLVMRKLDINQSLREEPMPDMGPGQEENPTKEGVTEQSNNEDNA